MNAVVEKELYIGFEVLTAVVTNVANLTEYSVVYSVCEPTLPPAARWFLSRLFLDTKDGVIRSSETSVHI
jgi:hypothetical protein